MSVTRARLPMLVGVLMAVSLVAAGCGDGSSSPDAGPGGTDGRVQLAELVP